MKKIFFILFLFPFVLNAQDGRISILKGLQKFLIASVPQDSGFITTDANGQQIYITNQQARTRLGIDTIAPSGGVADGDKGDIIVTSGIWDLDTNAIPFLKLTTNTNPSQIDSAYRKGYTEFQGISNGEQSKIKILKNGVLAFDKQQFTTNADELHIKIKPLDVVNSVDFNISGHTDELAGGTIETMSIGYNSIGAGAEVSGRSLLNVAWEYNWKPYTGVNYRNIDEWHVIHMDTLGFTRRPISLMQVNGRPLESGISFQVPRLEVVDINQNVYYFKVHEDTLAQQSILRLKDIVTEKEVQMTLDADGNWFDIGTDLVAAEFRTSNFGTLSTNGFKYAVNNGTPGLLIGRDLSTGYISTLNWSTVIDSLVDNGMNIWTDVGTEIYPTNNEALYIPSIYSGTGNLNLIGRFDQSFPTSTLNNIVIGQSAGSLSLTGDENIYIGVGAGLSNTTANGNIFIGRDAGYSNTIDDNTAVGNFALQLNTTSAGQTAFGAYALQDVTGAQNTAVGTYAGLNVSVGTGNTIMGFGAGYSMTTSAGNTIIGNGVANATQTGNYNVMVGFQAGYGSGAPNNSASDNVILGVQAGNSLNGNGNVFIGRNAGANETGSEKLYIDNTNTSTPLIGGDFSANTVSIGGDLLPSTDDTYNLGSASKQWKDLFMTGSSIYFNGVKTISSAGLDLPTGAGLRTRTSDTNTLLLQAYDVDGAAYTTFGTLTAGNTPTFDLSAATKLGGTTFGSLATQSGTFSGTSSGTNTGDQTFSNTSDATSHTLTLSSSGGSFKIAEGSNITITTSGTGSDGIATIASTGGGLADGDKGDITVSSSGSVWDIDAGVVGATEIASTSVPSGDYYGGGYSVDADGRLTAAYLPKTISPSQITSDQDNYNPTGFGNSKYVRINADNRMSAITSMVDSTGGCHEKTLINTGSYMWYIPQDHPDATAANRFTGYPGDYYVYPGQMVDIWKDNVSDKWRIKGSDFGYTKPSVYYSFSGGSITAADYGDVTFANSGTGAVFVASAATATMPAGATGGTGSTSSGTSNMYFCKATNGQFATFGVSHIFAESLMNVPTLSDGSQTVTIHFKLNASPTSASLTANSVIGIRYSHGINSGKFEGFCRNSGGTESTVDLGTTVVAATRYKLRIEVDKSLSEARFYINGTYAGRVTSNLPSSGVQCGAQMLAVKTVGSTAIGFTCHSFTAGAIYP